MERILVGHCVRLVSLLSSFVSALLCCSPLHVSQLRTAVSASRLQSLTFSQLWAAVSASLAILYNCLPVLDCCVCLSLAILTFAVSIWAAVSASALQSSTCAAQLWTPLSPPLLATLYMCLPALDCSALQSFTCVYQLWAACCLQSILYMCLPVSTYVSQLWTAVPASALQSFTFVSQLWAAVSASALQSFTFASQRWAVASASALQSFTFVLAVLCVCLPALDCCVPLCLAILCLPALNVASSSCRAFRL